MFLESPFQIMDMLTILEAYMIPERIGSLTLLSTAARLVNTVGYFENLRNRINML